MNAPNIAVFDLDGTLAESKSPATKEMGALLARLLRKMPVAVMSGGAWKQFEKQLLPSLPSDALLDRLYLFPTSAAECLRYENGAWKTVYTHRLSDEERARVLRALDEALAKTGMEKPPAKVWGERVEDRGAQITFSGLGQEAPPEEKKAWDPDKKKRGPLVEALKRKLPDFSIRANAMSSVDITRDGITKAYGVRELAKLSGIPIRDMLYVGDALFPGGNDEVVKETGIPTRPVDGPADTATVIEELLTSGTDADLLKETLAKTLTGDVTDAPEERAKYKRDTSIFEREPSLVVYPKDADDVSALVRAVREAKEQAIAARGRSPDAPPGTFRGEDASIAARSAGTDMSGGSLTRSVVAVFTKYMHKVREVGDGYAIAEPGTYYRDFERETLKKNLILPSYPASRNIAALGGIVANDSGGERSLEYGKTRRYVEALEVILSDGSKATFSALGPDELAAKKAQQNFEGEIYRKMSDLVMDNRELIEAHRPRVSKNSAGYALWDVFDVERGTFDLSKVITGSQGTLAMITHMKLRLVPPEPSRAMLVIFLKDLAPLPEIVRRVLKSNPESFESYDEHTFSLAVKYLPQMLSQMGLMRAARLGLSFLPEAWMAATGGIPKLVLMAEFSEDTAADALAKANEAQAALADLGLTTSVKPNEKAAEKYWIVRRESFALLRKNLSGLYASPFIDDFVVPPDTYPEFLPRLNTLLAEYDLVYTIAGHIGDGNFHIIPLMDLSKEDAHKTILELSPRVYDLVIEYGGTTTGEHNDGIIRTPYLPQLFGPDMVRLFEETKRIFDPLNILNPGKKVGGTFADIERDMIRRP